MSVKKSHANSQSLTGGFTCEICDKTFTSLRQWEPHSVSVFTHTHEQTNTCKLCNNFYWHVWFKISQQHSSCSSDCCVMFSNLFTHLCIRAFISEMLNEAKCLSWEPEAKTSRPRPSRGPYCEAEAKDRSVRIKLCTVRSQCLRPQTVRLSLTTNCSSNNTSLLVVRA